MKTRPLVLALIWMVLLSGCDRQLRPQECVYPGDGNWRITGNMTCSDKEIVLNGDLIISGSLRFENVNLVVNSWEEGQHTIEVKEGGSFEIIDSELRPVQPEFGYLFYYMKGSEGSIEGSVIEGTAAGEDFMDSDGHGGVGGLNIFVDGFVLRNSVIRSSHGRGVLIGGAIGVQVLNNTFADNNYDGLRVYECSDVLIANNIGYGNNEYAIKAMYSHDVTILNNTARNNKKDGIHLHTCEDVIMEGNIVYENGRNGFQIGPGREKGGCSGIIVRGNTINGNTGTGILFLTTSTSEITTSTSEISENLVEGNWESGITIQWEGGDVLVSGNTVQRNNWSGIVAHETSLVTISDNEVTANGHNGITFGFTNDSAASGNTVTGNNHSGVASYASQDITVSGNTISDNGDSGITVNKGSKGVTITGNTVTNHGKNGPRSNVYVSESDVAIRNNTISDSTGPGINLRGSTGTISGGSISGATDYGILVDASTATIDAVSLASSAVRDITLRNNSDGTIINCPFTMLWQEEEPSSFILVEEPAEAPGTEVSKYMGFWDADSLERWRDMLSDADRLKALGVNTISLGPPAIHSEVPEHQLAEWELKKRLLPHYINEFHRNGFRVHLAPYTYVSGTAPQMTPTAKLQDELAEWVEYYAEIAEEYNVELFSPLNEHNIVLGATTGSAWAQSVLPKIRERYSGLVLAKVTADEFLSMDFSGYDYLMVNIWERQGETDWEVYRSTLKQELEDSLSLAEEYSLQGVIVGEFGVPCGEKFDPNFQPGPVVSEESQAEYTDVFLEEALPVTDGAIYLGWTMELYGAKDSQTEDVIGEHFRQYQP